MSYATCIVSPEELGQPSVELGGEVHHHLFRVRRLAVGETVRLVDGEGTARWGTIDRVDARQATVRVGEAAPSGEAERTLEIWVAAPRPQRAAWLVEKATEVGVRAIRWIETGRSGREITPARLDRLRRVAAAAVEQSHRSRLPEISGPVPWPEVLAELTAAGSAWFLDTAGEETLPGAGSALGSVLLVGPEGGWTDEERIALVAAGATAARLGTPVLRVETAAVVGAALVLCR